MVHVPGHQARSEPGAYGAGVTQGIWERHRGEYTWAVWVFELSPVEMVVLGE